MQRRKRVIQDFSIENIKQACKDNNISEEIVERFKNIYEKRYGDFN